MPTYSYQCKNCVHFFESFHNMYDAPLIECSNCVKYMLERVLLSPPSFNLKGVCWYKTDYASDKSDQKTPATSSSSQSSGGETKQETVKHE